MLRLPHRKCRRRAKCGGLATLTVLVWGILLTGGLFQPPWAYGETTIVPSVAVAERYDSNIYYAAPQFLPPGTRLNDYVTSASANLKLEHKEKDVDVSILGGGDLNAYLYSSGLNYASTRVDGLANLNGWAERLAKGAQLRVRELFRYTPESPGFLGGGRSTEDPFLRGIQSFRANTFSNTTSVDGVYPLYRGLGLQAGYRYSLIRVGSVLVTGSSGISFFDTNQHAWSAGPRLQVSRIDSIALLFQQTLISQSLANSSGSSIDTNTQSLTANYTRNMQNWSIYLSAGGTLVEPASKAFATAALTIVTNPEKSTRVQLYASRQAAPSYYLAAGALISNVVQAELSHRLTRLLTLRGSANYGFNEIIPKEANTTFTSITFSAGLKYRLTKTMDIDVYYDHNDFKTATPTSGYTILRNAVGLTLTAEFR